MKENKLITCPGIPCPYKPYTKYGAAIVICTRQNCPVNKANKEKSEEADVVLEGTA